MIGLLIGQYYNIDRENLTGVVNKYHLDFFQDIPPIDQRSKYYWLKRSLPNSIFLIPAIKSDLIQKLEETDDNTDGETDLFEAPPDTTSDSMLSDQAVTTMGIREDEKKIERLTNYILLLILLIQLFLIYLYIAKLSMLTNKDCT